MSKLALLSVYDKTNIVQLAEFLINKDFIILSTGGTAKHLVENNINVTNISDYTEYPEILNGRVKTLHPKIYGGILNIRDNKEHQHEINRLNIKNIDVIAVNLYPFEETIKKDPLNKELCIENIDIGGVSLLRAAAKNYNDVIILSQPKQYDIFMRNFNTFFFKKTINNILKKNFALDAFQITSSYDNMIWNWLNNNKSIHKKYFPMYNLKYGCNPHQKDAKLWMSYDNNLPFSILNGIPGYINILDALNSWCLVTEIKMSLNMDAATSFKHTSPAGVGLGTNLTNQEKFFYKIKNTDNISNIAIAYLRARNCDPKSSFGDFIAVNKKVDLSLAKIIKKCVSDGIIAPDYNQNAFDLLKTKKKGKFIILKGYEKNLLKDTIEFREYKNIVLSQNSNNYLITKKDLQNITTIKNDIPDNIINDMILSLITLKYTQSNSVGYAYQGQMIGIGAGQQSRIDCVQLARKKAETWYLRRHHKILSFQFKPHIKKQEKINLIIQYIDDDFTDIEYNNWKKLFINIPELMSKSDREQYIETIENVTLASDGFFPFRDSIDKASKINVKYVVQPGGSIADKEIIKACNEYNMCMVHTNIRLFHH